ncbi:4561_t:CDS:2, partial [Gigaspora rosea]
KANVWPLKSFHPLLNTLNNEEQTSLIPFRLNYIGHIHYIREDLYVAMRSCHEMILMANGKLTGFAFTFCDLISHETHVHVYFQVTEQYFKTTPTNEWSYLGYLEAMKSYYQRYTTIISLKSTWRKSFLTALRSIERSQDREQSD